MCKVNIILKMVLPVAPQVEALLHAYTNTIDGLMSSDTNPLK
jgi:hypothetical protein